MIRYLRIRNLLILFLFSAPQLFAGRLDEQLALKLGSASQGQSFKVIVMMKEQVDLDAITSVLDAAGANRQERHEVVVRALMEMAERTQVDINGTMTDAVVAGEASSVKYFWIKNIVAFKARAGFIRSISDRADVDVVYEDVKMEIIRPVGPMRLDERNPIEITNSVEPGLLDIGARYMWNLDFTGDGTIVMGIDTGVSGNHPALQSRWRGTEPGVPWQEAWFDPYGGSSFPYDSQPGVYHGTHTMGTMTGLSPTTNDTIGMAWGAQWIAALGLMNGSGGGAELIQCFQWGTDPDGNPATIADVPHVINNSWGAWAPNSCYMSYWSVMDAAEAAGVAVVFANGNLGPGSATTDSPASKLSNPVSAFAIGALNAGSTQIASYSSRGPSACQGTDQQRIKPEVCARGTSVRSSVGTAGYGYISGTSMAAPHAAGAIALMAQAFPDASPYEWKMAMLQSAFDLGLAGEDNKYGMGRIDLEAAYAVLQNNGIYIGMAGSGDSWGTPGSQDRPVELLLTNYVDISGAIFTIEDIPDWLDAVSVNPLLPGATANVSDNGSFAVVELDIPGTPVQPSELLPVVEVLYDVSTSAVLGETIDLVVSELRLVNTSGDTMFGFPGDTSTFIVGRKADLDGDGEVDIFDIITVINIVLDRIAPTQYQQWAADVNDNGVINIFDILQTINIVLSGGLTKASDVGMNGSAHLSLVPRVDARGELNELNLIVTNNTPLLGAQIYIDLKPDSKALKRVEASPRLSGMNLAWNADANGLLLLIYTDNGTTLNPGSAPIVTLSFEKGETGSAEITEALAADGGISPVSLTWSENTEAPVPESYTLFDNYPNPFNPSTKIGFYLPERTRVNLTVFDLAGREVITLLDETQEAGGHSVEWEGASAEGMQVASGIYIYRLTTPSFSSAKKMVLLR